MRIALSAIALALALAATTPPAAAQRYSDGAEAVHFRYEHPYERISARHLDDLRDLARQGVSAGSINRREAQQLWSRLQYVRDLRQSYTQTRGGMSPWEADDLRARIRLLRVEIREAMWEGRTSHSPWNEFDTYQSRYE